MANENDKSELNILQKEINFHNYRYHVLDQPLISDYEYDMKLKRLRELEKIFPELVGPDSPTQRAGALPIAKFEKVKHPEPILSLANAFDNSGIKDWFDRILKLDSRVAQSGYMMEPKIDGLTVVLHYKDGILVLGATRGDGEFGEDITSNIRTVKSVPLSIPLDQKSINAPKEIVVRGEVFIKKTDFDKLNQKLEEAGDRTYQNPRNTAAGSLRQLDPALTRARPLTLLTYAIVKSSDPIPSTQKECLDYLAKLGFPVSGLSEYAPNIQKVLDRTSHWAEVRDAIEFEIDGVVIKLNDLSTANELGFVGKDPRGAIALKFPAREISTIIKDIGINVGRTGVLTPVAVLEPVELGGVIIKQATLHNFDYIFDKDIRIGDRVMIKRAGDVIPYVIGPIVDARSGKEKAFTLPTTCPSCKQPVEHIEGEVAWYCVNAACPAQLVRNIEHFVARDALDITGLGIKVVEQLIENGLVHDFVDLFRLNKGQLLNLEGFAVKKAENLLEAINLAKSQPFERWIIGLGIHGVGEVGAKDLSKHYSDLKSLERAGVIELQKIEGIGPNTAQSIVDWFEREGNRLIIEKMINNQIWPVSTPSKINAEGPLKNLLFVITGTLSSMSREEAKVEIEKRGGKVTDSVSKNTNYLVVGENAGSKLDKARILGVTTLTEQSFVTLIGK